MKGVSFQQYKNANQFIVTADYEFKYIFRDRHRSFVIPRGFVSDGASIPRILWPIYPRFGLYTNASFGHDYAYASKIMSKAHADELFLSRMEMDGVRWSQRHVFYHAVSWFGDPENCDLLIDTEFLDG